MVEALLAEPASRVQKHRWGERKGTVTRMVVVPPSTLHDLGLSTVGMDSRSVRRIAQLLESNKCLTRLDLRY